jgi:hypothetical protein
MTNMSTHRHNGIVISETLFSDEVCKWVGGRGKVSVRTDVTSVLVVQCEPSDHWAYVAASS